MKRLNLSLFILLAFNTGFCQSVGIGTTTPNASAILDLKSNSQGILIPRLSQEQRTLITSPAKGLMVYQNDQLEGFYFYTGTVWLTLSTNSSSSIIQLNKIVFSKEISNGNFEIWTANYDGTNQTKVNIILPIGISYSQNSTPQISPDGKKKFFTAGATDSVRYGAYDIYSVNIDGTALTKIISAGNNLPINIGGAY